MKKLVFLTTLILLASLAVATFAVQEQMGVEATATATKKTAAVATAAQISNAEKTALKTTLKSYFSTVIHGYGIGFTEETYITAKWHVTNVRTLNRASINAMIREAKQGNNTDWEALRERIRVALESAYTTVKKGRISIEGRNYVLTDIFVSNESMTADIREIPDYAACNEVETNAEVCEETSDKVGEIAITKRTKPNQEIPGEPKVWAGTLSFNDVRYTFVTFAYPR